MSKPEKVIFTKNSTEAINLLFTGLLEEGVHVIVSCYEHNAVLRPLHNLKQKGVIDYSIIQKDDLLLSAEDIFARYAKENTKLIAITLASNLTGRIIFREDWMRYFHEKGVITFVDSSQGAGKVSVSMKDAKIDYLAFTAHKDLYGIPGVGGLCCETWTSLKPLIQGGTGVHGENYVNPMVFPEGYEAGTLNMPAIWALKTGIEYIETHSDEIKEKESELMDYLIQELRQIERIVIYDFDVERVPTCCFTLEDMPTDRVIVLLDQNGICARGGIHCAILAHEALGTVETGTVRISLNYRNTMAEIDKLIRVLRSR